MASSAVLCGCAEEAFQGPPSAQYAPAPGPSPEGWQAAFLSGSRGLSCGDTAARVVASDIPRVTVGETTIVTGYESAGGLGENPVVARYDGDTQVFCRVHESDEGDARAVGITWDGGDVAYVLYTVSGSTHLDAAVHDGWLSEYAPGAVTDSGRLVSFIGRLDTRGGLLTEGTYIIGVSDSGQTAAHVPTGPLTVLPDGALEFRGSSDPSPVGQHGYFAMICTDRPFNTRYVLSADLSELICAESTNCEPELPCE